MRSHLYKVALEWTGNDGSGTTSYTTYRRDYTIAAPGKPVVHGSSDPSFRGSASRYNPEELLVASLSSCHMLWYLHLCATAAVHVLAYADTPTGLMEEDADGSGLFKQVHLRPTVTISAASDPNLARHLHEKAHSLCFIARSVNFPVSVTPAIVANQS